MNREEKTQLLGELNELFNSSEIIVVSHYKGLTVKEVSELRDKIRKGKRKQANGQPEYSRSIPVLLQGLLCLSLLSFAEDTQKTTWTWDHPLKQNAI